MSKVRITKYKVIVTKWLRICCFLLHFLFFLTFFTTFIIIFIIQAHLFHRWARDKSRVLLTSISTSLVATRLSCCKHLWRHFYISQMPNGMFLLFALLYCGRCPPPLLHPVYCYQVKVMRTIKWYSYTKS